MGAFGWGNEEVDYIEAVASSGNEPIGSLGYDGPLAVLAPEGHNLADYYKEIVAVVTNPSMDRERETEHFNTQTILGQRPPLEGTRDKGLGTGGKGKGASIERNDTCTPAHLHACTLVGT
jgi:hypothetical protein